MCVCVCVCVRAYKWVIVISCCVANYVQNTTPYLNKQSAVCGRAQLIGSFLYCGMVLPQTPTHRHTHTQVHSRNCDTNKMLYVSCSITGDSLEHILSLVHVHAQWAMLRCVLTDTPV